MMEKYRLQPDPGKLRFSVTSDAEFRVFLPGLESVHE